MSHLSLLGADIGSIDFLCGLPILNILLGIEGNVLPLLVRQFLFVRMASLRYFGCLDYLRCRRDFLFELFPAETVTHVAGGVTEMVEMLPTSLTLVQEGRTVQTLTWV